MEKRVQKRSSIKILFAVLFACMVCLAVLFALPFAGKTSTHEQAHAETADNNLRTQDGNVVTSTKLSGWTYGKWSIEDSDSVKAVVFRPEHGNTVFYSYYRNGDEKPVEQLAIVYSNEYSTADLSFYEVEEENGEYVLGKCVSTDSNYLYEFNYDLAAGNYKLKVTIPQVDPTGAEHRHWYEGNKPASDYGVTYSKRTFDFTFTIETYLLSSDYKTDSNLRVVLPEQNYIEYTGDANRTVLPDIWLCGRLLELNVDYELSTPNVDAGVASLTVKGINNLEGEFTIWDAFTIVRAGNDWYDVPSISHWAYNAFDRAINLISAEPEFGKDTLWFSISRDEAGNDLIDGLEHITLDENGQVSKAVADILKGLRAGVYYLRGFVDETENYEGLSPNAIEFRVFVATNSWKVAPLVNSWTEGEYSADGGHIVASPVFGVAHVLIVDDEEKVYFDSDNGIDILSEAKPGRYTLTAYVDAGEDYYGLDVYTVVFEVFKKPALPWWATTSIVVGAVALAALVIFILWRMGVFQILTEKIVVSARTRASVEATIASLRATKMMEEGRQSVEDAKRRERLEEMRKKDEAELKATQEASAQGDDTTFVFAGNAPQDDSAKAETSGEEKPAVEISETPSED